MRMLAFDYMRDRADTGPSMARLATVIKQHRETAANSERLSLLVDNGDLVQGTPVAEFLALPSTKIPHPMAACINAMAYDALGLGNHDFDHGLAQLDRIIEQFDAPAICTNLSENTLTKVVPWVHLERNIKCCDGKIRPITIGIASVLPHQTARWNRHQLQGHGDVSLPLPALRKAVTNLRKQGADIVIVLAHMGIAVMDEGNDPQNQVSGVAAIKGVDAVIGGHTHLLFPGPDHLSAQEADCQRGTIHGVPVVMPGAPASHLGVIELDLEWVESDQKWTIYTARSTVEPVGIDIPQDPTITACVHDAHEATRRYLAEPVASLTAPMNSFFTLARAGSIASLLAGAKKYFIAKNIAGTGLQDLPLLSVGSTAATGGFDGPDNFVCLARGCLKRRDIAGLNPYANQVWAVRTNGARLVDWLERSTLIFKTLTPGQTDQELINVNVPGFRFDTIFGLTYEIDPTQPPFYDLSGQGFGSGKGRISNVRWKGAPLDLEQEFLVATTDHRTSGSGAFEAFSDSEIVFRDGAPLSHALIEYLQSPDFSPQDVSCPWRFKSEIDCSVILLSAPEAANHLNEIADLSPEYAGLSSEGFARIRLLL